MDDRENRTPPAGSSTPTRSTTRSTSPARPRRRRTWCRRCSSTCSSSATPTSSPRSNSPTPIRLDAVADRRARAEPRRAPRDAARTEAEDPRNLRDEARPEARGRMPSATRRRSSTRPPSSPSDYRKAVKEEQLRDLEDAVLPGRQRHATRSPAGWCSSSGGSARSTRSTNWPRSTSSPAARRWTCPRRSKSRRNWRTIDKLLKQLEEAKKTAQLAIIDMEELPKFAEPGDIERLAGAPAADRGLHPRAGREAGAGRRRQRASTGSRRRRCGCSSRRCSRSIFADLQASRTGRHPDAVVGEGAVESPKTKAYEFGDSVAQMDIPASMVNALLAQRARACRCG